MFHGCRQLINRLTTTLIIMTHFLRDQNNKTIVDIEVVGGDVSGKTDEMHCVVIIKPYSEFLLKLWWWKRKDFILDINAISEIRGIFWETYNAKKDGNEIARTACKYLSIKWDLEYVAA